MSKKRIQKWPMTFFPQLSRCRGSSFHYWICQHPKWNARKANKRKPFLKGLGEELVDAEISKRIQTELRKTSRAAIEQMGYFIQQTVADTSHTPDELVPKTKEMLHVTPQQQKKNPTSVP